MKGCWHKDIGQLQASVTAGETAKRGIPRVHGDPTGTGQNIGLLRVRFPHPPPTYIIGYVMEIVKRKYLNIGSTYGSNLCCEANFTRDDPESPKFSYSNRPLKRGGYYKCIFCRFEHKPAMCEKFACIKSERKEGKTVFFGRA